MRLLTENRRHTSFSGLAIRAELPDTRLPLRRECRIFSHTLVFTPQCVPLIRWTEQYRGQLERGRQRPVKTDVTCVCIEISYALGLTTISSWSFIVSLVIRVRDGWGNAAF